MGASVAILCLSQFMTTIGIVIVLVSIFAALMSLVFLPCALLLVGPSGRQGDVIYFFYVIFLPFYWIAVASARACRGRARANAEKKFKSHKRSRENFLVWGSARSNRRTFLVWGSARNNRSGVTNDVYQSSARGYLSIEEVVE